ncbi:MAG: DUF4349 domain-containing protein, partial [Spirochaetaceae bacterium]|nr:DUF4349 domain-containing protein [Spirochaetaceae bacterium]
MKRRTLVLLVLGGLFLLLFAARFAYELRDDVDGPSGRQVPRGAFLAAQNFDGSGSSPQRKNYASEKIVVAQAASPQVLDQKYERVADLSARSRDFEADSKRVAEVAAERKALVQSENSYGLPGDRVLALSLGVVPEAFDATVAALRGVGELESVTVTKTDRTADFRALEAKRLSLEKTRDGLRALRRAGAELADLIALETKILEIEGQIQELGVSLGDYSEQNSFCTINLSLRERAAAALGPRLLRAALDALGWSVLVCLGAASASLAAT